MWCFRSVVAAFLLSSFLELAFSEGLEKFFRYTGDKQDFDETHAEHKGSITYHHLDVFNEEGMVGPPSLKALEFTQRYDPAYKGRYHSEITLKKAYKTGDKGYYGFAFKIPENWEWTDDIMTIMQFIADFGDWNEVDSKTGKSLKGKGWSPSTKVWLSGKKLYTRTRGGSVLQEDVHWKYIADVSKDKWHTLVLGVDWEEAKVGKFQVWYDGKKVIDEANVATTMKADNREFVMRAGLYATDWHNHNNHMRGEQQTRSIYMDRIAMGTSYEEADPMSFGCCHTCDICRKTLKKYEEDLEELNRMQEQKETVEINKLSLRPGKK